MMIKPKRFYQLLLCFCILISFKSYSQSDLFEDNLQTEGSTQTSLNDLAEEKIIRISPSKRIFLISNQNGTFGPGDFISLVFNSKLAARAIVAKDQNGRSGIKIIKIYSIDNWKDIKVGSSVKILRGDDSFFKNEAEKKAEKDAQVLTDEELFDTNSLIEQDGNFEDKKNRHIKTDNIVGFNYGRVACLETGGASTNCSHYSARWSYQFSDNFWADGQLGQSQISPYPQDERDRRSNGLTTILTSLTVRIKYTFTAPFFIYVKPYIGYQILNASSDGAGDTSTGLSEATAAREIEQLNSLEKKAVVFGATILKRMVPGWFFTAEIGTDIVNIGLALEF